MRICQYISWCALIIEIGGLLLGHRETFVFSSLLSAGVTMGASFSAADSSIMSKRDKHDKCDPLGPCMRDG